MLAVEMSDLDPTQYRVLLVGPRVVHLRPFFEKRHYPVVAAPKGVEGMAHLDDTDPCDVVVLELNLGDLTATEFLMAARQGHPAAIFLLLDEATKAGQIVKTLQAGLDGYLATPPDEERLFYEVERHLRRRFEGGESSGFEDNSTQTAMTTMAEVEAIQAAVADRDAQILEANEELERSQQSLRTLREDARRFEDDARRLQEVQVALAGHLERSLDKDEAIRLRERLGLAQIAEIELQSLRDEVHAQKSARKEMEKVLDDTRRELTQVRAAAEDAIDIPVIDEEKEELSEALEALKDEAAELRTKAGLAESAKDEADAALVDLRSQNEAALAALEAARTEAQTAIAARRTAEAAFEAERSRLSADLENLQTQLATSASPDDAAREARQAAEAAAAVKLAEKDAALVAVQAALAEAEAALDRERARGAEEDITRAAAEEDAISVAVEEAVEKALAEAAVAAKEAEVAAVAAAELKIRQTTGGEATRTIKETTEALNRKVRAAEEKATDIELQLEEARTRVEFLEMDAGRVGEEAETKVAAAVAAANDRVAEAEAEFKREKLRLIEEKQLAATGSQEAVLRIERFVEENNQLRRQAAELEGMREGLETTAREATQKAEEARAAATSAAEALEAESQRCAAAIEASERVDAAMATLQAHAQSLDDELKGALKRIESQKADHNAAIDHLQAEVRAAREALADAKRLHEDAVAGDQARLLELEAEVQRLQTELETSTSSAASLAANSAAATEAAIAARDEALRRLEEAVVEGASAREAQDERHAAAVAAVEARASRLADQVAALEAAIEERDSTLQRTQDSIAAAGDQGAALTEAQAALGAETARAASLEAELARERAEAQQKTVDVDDLKRRLSEVQEALDAASSVATSAAPTGVDGPMDASELVLGDVSMDNAPSPALEAEVAKLQDALAVARSEVKSLQVQLPQLANERDRLLSLVASLEGGQGGASAYDKGQGVGLQSVEGGAMPGPGTVDEVEVLKQRIAVLEGQLAQLDPAMLSTVRSLVEAVDPLRWGLGAAVDYLAQFEGNDTTLASHIRNLRLLQATLARLVAESGKSAAAPAA